MSMKPFTTVLTPNVTKDHGLIVFDFSLVSFTTFLGCGSFGIVCRNKPLFVYCYAVWNWTSFIWDEIIDMYFSFFIISLPVIHNHQNFILFHFTSEINWSNSMNLTKILNGKTRLLQLTIYNKEFHSMKIVSIPTVRLWLFTANIFTARKRSLGQGNVFTHVCHSVHGGGVYPSI